MLNLENILTTKVETSISTKNNKITESYFSNCLDFITENNQEYRELTLDLYKSISEASSSSDASSIYNLYFNKMTDITNKIFSYMDKTFMNYQKELNNIINKDKIIFNNEKMFKSYNNNIDDWNQDRYIFSNLNTPITIPKIVKTEYEKETEVINDIINSNRLPEEKVNMLKNVYETLINSIHIDFFYDEFRAKLLKSSTPIKASDFNQKIFYYYRNNKKMGTIEQYEIADAFDLMLFVKNNIDLVKKEKIVISNEYLNIRKELNNSFMLNKNIIRSTDLLSVYDNYLKAKLDQILTLSNIHTIAFCGKLDAMSQAYMQSRDILYYVLNYTKKEDE